MGHQDCEVWEVEKQPGLASQCAVYSRGFEITLLARKRKKESGKSWGQCPCSSRHPRYAVGPRAHPHGTLWQYSCPTLLGEPHHLLQHLLLGSTRVGWFSEQPFRTWAQSLYLTFCLCLNPNTYRILSPISVMFSVVALCFVICLELLEFPQITLKSLGVGFGLFFKNW